MGRFLIVLTVLLSCGNNKLHRNMNEPHPNLHQAEKNFLDRKTTSNREASLVTFEDGKVKTAFKKEDTKAPLYSIKITKELGEKRISEWLKIYHLNVSTSEAKGQALLDIAELYKNKTYESYNQQSALNYLEKLMKEFPSSKAANKASFLMETL